MDIRKIKKLIELVEESGIDELEITEGEESVRIARNRAPSAVSYSLPPAMAAMAAPIAAAPAADAEASKGTAASTAHRHQHRRALLKSAPRCKLAMCSASLRR